MGKVSNFKQQVSNLNFGQTIGGKLQFTQIKNKKKICSFFKVDFAASMQEWM